MCGIFCAIGDGDVSAALIQGLYHSEYRGKLLLSRAPRNTVKGWRRAGAGRGTEEG